MKVLSIALFIFSLCLLAHAVRDFLHHRRSKVWFAQAGHERAKQIFDSACDKLGLSFLKDKEWLHSLICASFGILFLVAALLIG